MRDAAERRRTGIAARAEAARAVAPALPLPDRPAIAVLPFINMSGDPEQEYFSDGISEDIITALSKLRWFFVIARNSSFIYKGKAVHMKQVAEELGVGYVVEGSVRKGGDRVRITAQLNDVATGSHIWAERYDRNLADVFAVQDEITEAIVAAIEPQLYAAENFRSPAQAARQPGCLGSGDAGAVALLARDAAGQSWWRRPCWKRRLPSTRTTARHSACLPPAIPSAPTWVGRTWRRSAPIAERAAQAAILADSEDPWAHQALGYVYLFARRFEDLLAEFELALRLNPNFALALGYYGVTLCLLRALGRRRPRRPPRAAAQSARPVFGDLLRHRRLRAVRRA